MTKFCSLVGLAFLLSSCVSNRAYNLNKLNAPTSVVAVQMNTSNGRLRTDKVAANCDPLKVPCLAFLEFDEFGEAWDKTQLPRALALIDRAKSKTPPIVVSFVHGWKNNADDRDGRQNNNLTAFEGVLESLRKDPKYGGAPVVGIYLSFARMLSLPVLLSAATPDRIRTCLQRQASPPPASRVSRLLPSEPHASRPEQRRPGRQAGVCRVRPDHRLPGSRRLASPLTIVRPRKRTT